MFRLLFILAVFFTISLPALAGAADDDAARFDGPAELPRIYLKSALADTPAPGDVHLVKAGSNLQDAFDHVSCGETLALEAGATFTGRFVLRNKNCDDAHWIIIRTDAPDDELPKEGSRVTPCYAGVASLPGRPDFHCVSTRNVLAKLLFEGKAGIGPIVFAAGANHYRLENLEITRAASDYAITALIASELHTSAHHIVLDRLWVHGTAQDETTRGLYLTGTSYVAVVDSFFSDFHCVSVTGSCTDSQAIAGGMGDNQDGPYKIFNNYLEASGENIIFGGGPATTTPADIEIRHNYLFKPLIWMPNQPGFIGGKSGRPFVVKNLFELKNAQRLLFEGNILENSWGGVGQNGYAILLTPKNQAPNLCPACRVTDITLRNCKIAHTASALNIANVPSDSGGLSSAGERYSLHDLLFEDIDGTAYKGFGAFAVVLSNGPQLQDVKIDHITAFAPNVFMSIGAKRDRPLPANFSITNSIFSASKSEVSSAGGGPQNCAFGQVQLGPEAILRACFSSSTFTNNIIIDPQRQWPKGNFFPKNEDAVGFVNFNHGLGGDYHLCQDKNSPAGCKEPSRYLHKAADGKDPGADMDAVAAATRGVQSGTN